MLGCLVGRRDLVLLGCLVGRQDLVLLGHLAVLWLLDSCARQRCVYARSDQGSSERGDRSRQSDVATDAR